MKKNLLQILKTNGTGLLAGLCRIKPIGPYPKFPQSFEGWAETWFQRRLPDKHEEIEVIFSLNEIYLGTYMCRSEVAPDLEESTAQFVIYTEEDDKINSIYLYVYFSVGENVDFGEFKAIARYK